MFDQFNPFWIRSIHLFLKKKNNSYWLKLLIGINVSGQNLNYKSNWSTYCWSLKNMLPMP